MFSVNTGDIAIFETIVKNKSTGKEYYYSCEAISGFDEQRRPLGQDGKPMVSARSIYKIIDPSKNSIKKIMIKRVPDMDDKEFLLNMLTEKFGPGELIKEIRCEGVCRLKSLKT
jgi:hypothetical protein